MRLVAESKRVMVAGITPSIQKAPLDPDFSLKSSVIFSWEVQIEFKQTIVCLQLCIIDYIACSILIKTVVLLYISSLSFFIQERRERVTLILKDYSVILLLDIRKYYAMASTNNDSFSFESFAECMFSVLFTCVCLFSDNNIRYTFLIYLTTVLVMTHQNHRIYENMNG